MKTLWIGLCGALTIALAVPMESHAQVPDGRDFLISTTAGNNQSWMRLGSDGKLYGVFGGASYSVIGAGQDKVRLNFRNFSFSFNLPNNSILLEFLSGAADGTFDGTRWNLAGSANGLSINLLGGAPRFQAIWFWGSETDDPPLPLSAQP